MAPPLHAESREASIIFGPSAAALHEKLLERGGGGGLDGCVTAASCAARLAIGLLLQTPPSTELSRSEPTHELLLDYLKLARETQLDERPMVREPARALALELINHRTELGHSLLSAAASVASAHLVRAILLGCSRREMAKLVEGRLSTNGNDRDGMTPLHLACLAGRAPAGAATHAAPERPPIHSVPPLLRRPPPRTHRHRRLAAHAYARSRRRRRTRQAQPPGRPHAAHRRGALPVRRHL